MTRIGLLSDTHTFIHPSVYDSFKNCDEIWHAGDIGNYEAAQKLEKFKPFKAVFGNIDGQGLRQTYPETLIFYCEEVKVFMKHIGGYPGRYDKSVRDLLPVEKPQLFISGHSHILKVMYDEKHQLLHINPGAAGKSGMHQVITLVRFIISGNQIKDLEIIELKKSGM